MRKVLYSSILSVSSLFAHENEILEYVENLHKFELIALILVPPLFVFYRQYLLKKHNEELESTQKELEKSLLEFEHVFDTTMEAIGIFENGKCIKINEEAVKIFGYENKEQMIGITPFDVMCESSHDTIKHNLQIKTTAPYEVVGKKRDGTLFPALIKGHSFETNGRNLRITSLVDLTEVRMKDKILAEQSKMASMGEMMANIAHQWRQPLSVISTATSGMQLKREMDILSHEDFNEYTEAILKNSSYLSHTIDDFKNFLQKDKKISEFNLEKSIYKIDTIISSALINKDILLIKDLDENIIVENIENELIQALINIVNNAKDAIDENLQKEEKRFIFITTKKEDDKIQIIIKDNAGGIPEDILNRIFEPYFTTKHKSQGTGLGLYMSHQIITQSMKGSIEVINQSYKYAGDAYKGACFTITL